MSESINLSNWLEPPHDRWGFHHVADLLDTVPISNESGDVTALPRESVHLDDVSFTSADGSTTTWGRHLNETFCDAICVVHKGSIVDERYFNNLTDKSQHLLMSVTKSVTAAALGISIGRVCFPSMNLSLILHPSLPVQVLMPAQFAISLT